MKETEKIIFKLVSWGLECNKPINIPTNIDWEEVFHLTTIHGILGICLDGIEKLESKDRPPQKIIMKWIGHVIHLEYLYEKHKKVLMKIGAFYGKHNIPIMLLKGYGLSLNYPKPSHRPLGDIDLYMYGKWKEADNLISSEIGVEVDNSHHHHTVFHIEGQSVENHYDFINVHSHRGNLEIENVFKKLAKEEGEQILYNIYVPSPKLNLLFVARHTAIHFAAGELILRQILDWALLAKGYEEKDVDWNSFWSEAHKMGMDIFVRALCGIANEYLGFSNDFFHIPKSLKRNIEIENRILVDMFAPDFGGQRPKGYLGYMIWIFHRWWAHRWKHKLVYNDSLFSTFWWQFVSHLKKPKTLRGV